jgi:protein-disulfide isomerase
MEQETSHVSQKAPTQNPYLVPISIVIAGVIIAGALFITRAGTTTNTPSIADQQAALEKVPAISAADHILGNPAAPIKIIEYSDLECPFCKRFHETMTQVMNEYGKDGKVAWVYRHFPIDGLHSKARNEAYATECAAEIGGESMFWKYMDKIIEITPSNNGLDPAELPKIAKDLGLDTTKFADCMASGKYQTKVDGSIADAQSGGALGTPWSIITLANDPSLRVPIDGALPYDAIKQAIDQLLASK